MNRVGKLLRERREQLGLRKEDIIRKLRIQIVYLDAIENGDFAFFRGQEYYQQVFVGSYADIIALDKKKIMALLQEDYEEFVNGKVHDESASTSDADAGKPVQESSFPDKLLKADLNNTATPEPSLLTPNPEAGATGGTQQSDPAVIDDLINQISTKPAEELGDLKKSFEEDEIASENDPDALLNSSIFDEIKKIEDKMEQNPYGAQHAKNSNDLTNDSLNQQNTFENDMHDSRTSFEPSAAQENTNALNQNMAQGGKHAPHDPAATQAQVFSGVDLNRPMRNDDVSVPQDQLISKEPSARKINMEDLAHAQRTTDQDGKTAIDLKVARALGGQEIEIDPNDAKRIRRDKIIDWILIIIAVVVVVYITLFLFESK